MCVYVYMYIHTFYIKEKQIYVYIYIHIYIYNWIYIKSPHFNSTTQFNSTIQCNSTIQFNSLQCDDSIGGKHALRCDLHEEPARAHRALLRGTVELNWIVELNWAVEVNCTVDYICYITKYSFRICINICLNTLHWGNTWGSPYIIHSNCVIKLLHV